MSRDSTKRCVPPCLQPISEDDLHDFFVWNVWGKHCSSPPGRWVWAPWVISHQGALDSGRAGRVNLCFLYKIMGLTCPSLSLVPLPDGKVLEPASGAHYSASSDWAEDTGSLADMEFESAVSEHFSCDERAYMELVEIVAHAVDSLQFFSSSAILWSPQRVICGSTSWARRWRHFSLMSPCSLTAYLANVLTQ